MFEENVQRGMALLDKYFGTQAWVLQLDLTELEMASTCKCIVGQLIGWDNLKHLIPDYEYCLDEDGEIDELTVIADYGFDVDDYYIERVAYGLDGELSANSIEESKKLYHQLDEDWIVAVKRRLDEGVKV